MKFEGRVYVSNIGVDRKKILKVIDPKEKDAVVWTGLIWLRIEPSCRLL
jgi:hypothetical protein